MQEFFVGNDRVDITRSQIVSEGEVIALEPKVLEVLTVLAQHAGEVVSHQKLHELVWPNTVVAPNALQRCIGQLRKALKDDGKSQRVIVTHPKKGYSLVATVSVRSEQKESKTPLLQLFSKPLAAAGLLVLLAIAVWTLMRSDSGSVNAVWPKFTQLAPLTATDASEFYSTFSPDGRYVAFSRDAASGKGHLWLLERSSGREIPLTRQAGNYGQPNWSGDGKRLAFINLDGCKQHCSSQRCVDINLLYVPLALAEPQEVSELLTCVDIPFQSLQWLDEQFLLAIVQKPDGSHVVRINSQTGELNSLYHSPKRDLYALTFSPSTQQLAIMKDNPHSTPDIVLLSTENGEVQTRAFVSPERYSSHLRWYPSWDPKGENLLFSAGPRLYLLDQDNQLHEQVIPTFQDISRPVFHPDGTSIAMTLGKVDRDIAELSLSVGPEEGEHYKPDETVLARSILRENDAQYQPLGKGIAYFSQRSGSRQLWYLTDNTEVQLTHLRDVFPEYYVWSPNGQQLMVSTEHRLYMVDLHGRVKAIELPFKATRLFQWRKDDRLLMQIVQDGQSQLVFYDIRHKRVHPVMQQSVAWAQSRGEEVYFVDGQHQVKRYQHGRATPLVATADIKTWSRFFIRASKLYLLASDDVIWALDLNSEHLQSLVKYPDPSVALTDVAAGGKRALISKRMSRKKEIVLLTP